MAEQDIVAAAHAVAALFREQRFYWLSRGWDEVQALLRATDPAAGTPAEQPVVGQDAEPSAGAAAQSAGGPATEVGLSTMGSSGEGANGDEQQAPQRA